MKFVDQSIHKLEPERDIIDALLLLWLWPWPDDLDIRIRPGHSEGAPAYQKWSF